MHAGCDPALREVLLGFLLEMSTSSELSTWLRDLGAETRGTAEEKKQRVRQKTEFLTVPTDDMIVQVIHALRDAQAGWAEELCARFGLSIDGSKTMLVRRVHRYLALRERQLPSLALTGPPTLREVGPEVAWYPVYTRRDYEKDHYGDFRDAMTDVFGENNVHEQMAVAHGSTLKIDFHIGSPIPGHGGVGVEFKMPANNSDVQKALGQMGQYQTCYRESLIVVIFPDLIDTKQLVPFQHELTRMNISHVVKKRWSE